MKRKITLVSAALMIALAFLGIFLSKLTAPAETENVLTAAKASANITLPTAENAPAPTLQTTSDAVTDTDTEEEAKEAEEARLAEEARKVEEAKLAEEARKVEEAKAISLPQSSTSVKALGIVSGSDVRLRSEDNTSASILLTLSKGTTVAVKGNSENWYQVSYDGKTGYISADYLTVNGSISGLSAYGKVTANDTLNLRSSIGGSVVTSVPAGYYVDVTGFDSGWYAISYNGSHGYVSGDYLALVAAKGTNLAPITTSPAPADTAISSIIWSWFGDSSTTGDKIAAKALEYKGYSYVYGGASPSTGFDCSGFTMYIYSLYDYALPHGATGQYSYGSSVSQSELKPGDLVFFTSSEAAIGHVGIYIGNREFVHASTYGVGVIVSSLDDGSYPSRYVGARRIVT